MERMMKCIKAILVTGILVVALSTCVNPFNWLAEVSDEVMLAKDYIPRGRIDESDNKSTRCQSMGIDRHRF